jgi:hypothetical protein
MKRSIHPTSSLLIAALALPLLSFVQSARANVYASNIKINGVLTGSSPIGQGGGAAISYILNEPASAGLTIKIFSGATPVRTISIAGGSSGTAQGLNTVAWDGKDDSSAYLPLGTYTVQITAASSGYAGPNWTQIVNNASPKIYWPSGVAVDTSTNSPYYGRVMVANGVNAANDVAPHPVGVVKFNADGSEADEGQSTPAGTFRTDPYLGDSCRSVKYGTDDHVYFLDWVGEGKVWRCDMQMTTSQVVFDSDLNPHFSSLTYGNADMDITDPGTTNGLVWTADSDYPSVGVWAFPLTNNVNNTAADSTSAGINVLAPGPNIRLRTGFGLMIDGTGDVFIGEVRANAADPTPRAISITNVWPSATGTPTNWWNATEIYPITATHLNWSVGQSDDSFRDIAALAVDSRTSPKYVACAMNGASGGLRILNAADGTLVANINQNVNTFYIGTCFDNVGNVYAGDANTATSWAAWSPPGSNSATTPATAAVSVVVRPHITDIRNSGGSVTIHFTAGASDPSSAFTLFSSGTVGGPYSAAAGATITGSAGSYTATVPASGGTQFYRIKR